MKEYYVLKNNEGQTLEARDEIYGYLVACFSTYKEADEVKIELTKKLNEVINIVELIEK